jgi:hypothetical protein
MAAIEWNDGRLITMKGGDTATCKGNLNAGQIYALFFYNSANNQADAPVNVVWSNSQPPVSVTVPGTTANQGLASLLFVSGSDTNTISASLSAKDPGVQIQAFIGSVKMPVNTHGINNWQLPADGEPHAFDKFTRYFTVPASHWYEGTISSDVNQFITVQFQEKKAVVNVVNQLSDPNLNIYYAGKLAQPAVEVNSSTHQYINWPLQGNGGQFVWINADSVLNSKGSTIALQSLSSLYKAFSDALETA